MTIAPEQTISTHQQTNQRPAPHHRAASSQHTAPPADGRPTPRGEAAARYVLQTADQVLAPTYTRPDRLFVEGRGAELWDAEGRRHIDFTSGVAVMALGHRSEVVAEAIRAATCRPVHISNLFHSEPAVTLAAELCRLSFADRVFYGNSGAEAVEGAIKFARLFHGGERQTIVSFEGSFHGRTLGALAATDRPDYQRPFRPLAGGFVQAPWDDEAGLEAIDEGTAAAIVEPIQGEMGIRVPSDRWLRALRRRCDEVGALLIFDEVQAGLGRTGLLWAHEPTGVLPDLMTLAKPLAGGLPMGAVLMTERVARRVTPGSHASTFGGGLLVAEVALAVLRTIAEPAFLAAVRRKGQRLREALRGLRSPLLRQVRGRGLFVGAQLTVPPAELTAHALAEGLLLVPAGDNVVRLLPPLNVDDALIDEAAALFGRALSRVEASNNSPAEA